ncbi:YggS family pyridoxal phosphate-dependent enzyme [Leptospira levettii]|uniref:YggS family pyridoxal phosphate-dependent enzyme n=1 Tax=Leptospira levettii TaxID=2023178 RepID=A0ABY2MIH2_9LEPT|nr:YggS family pyridoxal phosphate-dependent enzyme [Leptospira levettii]PKA25957.1 YggS family pyridoxal phosphate-dependent enzyme [Leptospira sp. mixed culture ATI2-C-A1]PJZ37501.1 YggS family pyridoxal phosphate-dependent enzyme [Leptospira levettii]PJZ86948.1 YggS family pyridoxal phosphate-dependent enzyme [Leptospira levettii]PKA00407.1 YggS family pyridoxal phosphate-dependent enzyme [Leptospira levettii]
MSDYISVYQSIQHEMNSLSQGNPPTLIAVSKTKPYEVVKEAYLQGIREFGENYIPEAIDKFTRLREEFPESESNVNVHHIGPVQSGTLRKLFGIFSYTHGVGSFSSLSELLKRAEKEKKKIRYFLQTNLTNENTKHGFSLETILTNKDELSKYQNEYCIWEGFMGMGPSSGDPNQTKEVFTNLAKLREEHFPEKKLSMGMSGDYGLAVELGSNFVRIGSKIFGERDYGTHSV